jgi:predicted ATPase with chaperone activity
LARGGVLFLDEISEFRSSALESILRIGRTRQVQLVFADTVPVSPRQQAIQASLTLIVDICVDLDPPKFHGPFQCNRTSADIKQRVGAARAFRQKHTPGILVAAMDYRDLAPNFSVGALALIRQNYGSGDRIDDSPRALRLMRVARTAADLEQAKEVTTRHVCRALLFTV